MPRSATLWPPRSTTLGLALLATACAHTPTGSPAAWHYTVAVAPDLGRLDVEVCFRKGTTPVRLVARERTRS